jgi:hypothetical protein
MSERSEAQKAEDRHAMLYGYHFQGDYHFQPAYAAGHVILSSFAELLFAQCFYNPEVVQIIRTLASGGVMENEHGKETAYKACKRDTQLGASELQSSSRKCNHTVTMSSSPTVYVISLGFNAAIPKTQPQFLDRAKKLNIGAHILRNWIFLLNFKVEIFRFLLKSRT